MGMEQPPEHKDKLQDALKAILPIILLIGGASCGLAWIIGQVKP